MMPASSAPFLAARSLCRVAPRISRTLRPLQPQHRPLKHDLAVVSSRPFSSTLYHLDNQTKPKASQKPLLEYPDPATQPPSEPRVEPPSYEISFTCEPCKTRSTHRISKQGYHHGSVLITCPECRNRHVISDHLNIFGDEHKGIEDYLNLRGQKVKKGTLSEDGDMEIWDDGTTSEREKKSLDKKALGGDAKREKDNKLEE